MELITAPAANPAADLPRIGLLADRHTLAKRRWRGCAEDGQDFGFDLERPLRHGEIFHVAGGKAYELRQTPEPVLAILILIPSQAARVAWQIGNLHFPMGLRADAILVEDDIAVRQMLERDRIPFNASREVFLPLQTPTHRH